MVPQPVLAVLLLFPVTEDSEKVKDQGVAAFHHQWPAAVLCSLLHIIAQSVHCMPAFCGVLLDSVQAMLPWLHSGRCLPP